MAVRWQRVADERGAALLFTVAVTLLVTLAVYAIVAVVVHEGRAGAAFRDSVLAFLVADAGLERAVFELRRDPNWADGQGATALLSAAGAAGPLCLDPQARGACPLPAESVPFPAQESLGTFTVRVAPHGDPRCLGPACVCVRSIGQAGGAVRRVEAVLTREGPEAPVRVVGWREVVEQPRGPCRP